MPTLPTTETIYSHDYRPAENTNHTKDKTNDDFKMSQRATINVDVECMVFFSSLLLAVPTLWSQSDISHKQTSRLIVKQPSTTGDAMFFYLIFIKMELKR